MRLGEAAPVAQVARQHAAPADGAHVDVGRQAARAADLGRHDAHALALARQALDPARDEAQHRVALVQHLGQEEQAHR